MHLPLLQYEIKNRMEIKKLAGTVERITFYNDENGYTVLRLKPTSALTFWSAVDESGLITVVGVMPELAPGENIELEGDWQTHSSYGQQFKAETVRRIAPATIEGIRRYLGSGLIKGIGPKTAERIVDLFGEETLNVLDNDPERLYEVDGVGRHRVHLIVRAWAEQKQIKNVMLFLQSHNVSTNLAIRIFKTYGEDAIRQVEEDPYRLARDVYGIGFRTADQIAKNMGLAHDNSIRLQAGLAYTLDQASGDGHVFLPEADLIEKAAELLDVPQPDIQASVEQAEQAELITFSPLPPSEEGSISQRAVYLPVYFHTEVGTARSLRNILNTPRSLISSRSRNVDWPALIAEAAAQTDAPLTGQQQEAVNTALTHKISVLTGGPGTGKTTTLRALIHVLEQKRHSFALASPTGRAAKRLSEATGYPASTIHRMLGYSPQQGFSFNEENPMPVDMIIIDESSMLDLYLAHALLKAVDLRSHLLFVGDVDQLPSVGAGDVLRDIISSDEVPVTRLKTIFRQAGNSAIIANAHAINQGDMPSFPDEAEDFFLFNIPDDPERAAELVVDIVQNRIPRRFGFHPLDDTQVIVPMYRGRAGVSALNSNLQEALNPPGRAAERQLGGRIFRVGDKVLQMRNDYEKEVFNGDIGRIQSLDFSYQEMTINFDDRLVAYDWADTQQLTHAYAISVHRSQGSEYPVVVMPVLTQHYMLLQRNLLYTAITRAKSLVVLVGSRKAVGIAINNDKVSQRYTALAARLRGEL